MSDVMISPRSRLVNVLRMMAALVLTGVLSGLGGMLLALLLHKVQHLAYGYSLDKVISDESFLQGVTQAPPLRRVLALLGAGLIAGLGWYALYRYGRKLIGIAAALQAEKPLMPVAETVIHALLQIITVALGSPLGREVAPRELGALAASRLGHWLNLSSPDTRLLIACGAGGGLAAVYNVPLGAALFVLEAMLARFHLKATLSALFTCALAALIARLGLGNEYQYHLNMRLDVSDNLLVWALLTGPIFGVAATLFVRITRQARQHAPRHSRIILTNLLNFTLLGLLVIILPPLAGNGKGPAELSFTSQLPVGLAIMVLVGKVFIQWSSLRSGAQGGLLTPGLANGALLALVFGALWSVLFPHNQPGAYAVIGAAAFLAASMKMPMTSLVLIMEFTHLQADFIVPIALCITGAVATQACLEKTAFFQRCR
ncbi:chloride channel protein [Dickeya lacustris]|uniref:chloride channel protein n=1 Tax=Dickeya lacustris TaxID=2259638 RepID=UPI000F6581C8|nr:chloride channel protein [Dickeya lacustris]